MLGIENTVVVTRSGCEILTDVDQDIFEVVRDCTKWNLMLKRSMLKLLFLVSLLVFCLLPPGVSYSFEVKGQDCAKCHTLGNDEARDLLKGIFPDIKIVDIRVSPAKAFWEVFSESGGKKGLIYVDFSKKYLILGPMISIKERKNLSKERLAELNKIDISQIPLDDALVMGDQKAGIRIIAFSDPD